MPGDFARGAAPRMGGPVGPVTFGTERGYFGIVRARFVDITPTDGQTFSFAQASVHIIGRDGSVLGYAALSKQWGQTPGWMNLAGIGMQPRMGRLRIGFNAMSGGTGSDYIGRWANFTLEIQWS